MTLARSSNSKKKSAEIQILTLSVIETSHMTLGQTFTITPSGLLSSKRKSKDNCVYAGTLVGQNSKIVNDIVLPEEENGSGKRHFLIKYSRGQSYLEKNKYFIKDMGEGLGTFIRLDTEHRLQNMNIVSFGDSHMVIHIDNSFINLRFIQGPKTDYKK